MGSVKGEKMKTMKTKADFMKDAKSGNIKLRLIGGENYSWIKEKRPQNLAPRTVVKAQTNAIYLEGQENGGKGSYLSIPAASLMEYDGETVSLYDPGTRDMTPEELANARAAEAERARWESENPYSDSFWHMKDFYRNCSTPWIYFGSGKVKGKTAGQGKDYGRIVDDSIKGRMVLQYAVERT